MDANLTPQKSGVGRLIPAIAKTLVGRHKSSHTHSEKYSRGLLLSS
jgi:ribosomal protein L13